MLVMTSIYLLLRSSPILEYSSDALLVIVIIGLTTAFFAATCSLVQNDLKRIITFSIISQLRYLILFILLLEKQKVIYSFHRLNVLSSKSQQIRKKDLFYFILFFLYYVFKFMKISRSSTIIFILLVHYLYRIVVIFNFTKFNLLLAFKDLFKKERFLFFMLSILHKEDKFRAKVKTIISFNKNQLSSLNLNFILGFKNYLFLK